MAIKLLDGGGTGTEAVVSNGGKLNTLSVSETPRLDAVRKAKAYGIISPEITLTSGAESGVLYLKNENADSMMVVDEISVSLGTSTGGSGDAEVRSIASATGGTLISAGTAVSPLNKNLGSTIPAQGTFLYGAQGSTVTGGSDINACLLASPSNFKGYCLLGVPNGTSVSIAVTPPSGNTSMALRVYVLFYYED